MFSKALVKEASELLAAYADKGFRLAIAESCTGGLIGVLLTEVPGASDVMDRGFITYSNEAKTEVLGVDKALIAKHGAVSKEVAEAMAKGARGKAKTDIGLSVTGIAGPGGGSKEKPVGLVYIAVATDKETVVEKNLFQGDRNAVRMASVAKAVEMLKDVIAK